MPGKNTQSVTIEKEIQRFNIKTKNKHITTHTTTTHFNQRVVDLPEDAYDTYEARWILEETVFDLFPEALMNKFANHALDVAIYELNTE